MIKLIFKGGGKEIEKWSQDILKNICNKLAKLGDAIASPSTYPCQSVGESVSQSLIVSNLEIAIASQSFASLV